MKYKVGDKVKIRHDLRADRLYQAGDNKSNNWPATNDMVKHAGQIGTIDKAYSNLYSLNEYGGVWTNTMFEGLEYHSPVSCKSLL